MVSYLRFRSAIGTWDGPGEMQYLAVPVLLSNVNKCFENLNGMGARDWQSC